MDQSHRRDDAALDRLPDGGSACLVPEFDVHDLETSLRFWCGVLGFAVVYTRPEDQFAFLDRDGAQVMLCGINGNWRTGTLEPPLGRGLNLQIQVRSVAPILERLEAVSWPLFRAPHEAWYRVGGDEVGLRQFLVQDPDGYLLRFAERLPARPLSPAGPAS